MDDAPIRLNLGAGDVVIEGFTPIDRKRGQEVYPLDYPDASVDEIRASHVLEHFSHRQVEEVLKHWVAKLKPGGRIRIAVPDFAWIANKYKANEPIDTQGFVMGGHADANDHHGCLFDEDVLGDMMCRAHLERISRWETEVADCASLPVSLNLQGYKPTEGDLQKMRVVAVLSAPRYAPTMHMRMAFKAFALSGIPYQIGQGAYWEQILSEQIEEILEATDLDFLVTVDYDSIFTAHELKELLRLMRAFPEYLAICALQAKRHCNAILFNVQDERGNIQQGHYVIEFTRPVKPIAMGHFGLTVFRVPMLRNLPRPWFLGKPGSDGRWHENKVDPDVSFWNRCRESGAKVGLACTLPIGHLTEVIQWPGKDLSSIYQAVTDYDKDGKPANTWG